MVTLDGAPWFVAKDVCDHLGLRRDSSNGYSHHLRKLDAAEVLPVSATGIKMPGTGMNNARLISESGLYGLVSASRKPEAEEFKRWVRQTVLPSIRKDGGYVLGEEKVATGELSEDELVLKVMQMQAAKVERLKAERDEALAGKALAEKQRDNNRAAADALAATVGAIRAS